MGSGLETAAFAGSFWAFSIACESLAGSFTSGYSILSWKTPVSTVEKALQIISMSRKVSRDLSS